MDTIDMLAGIGTRLDTLRDGRPQARAQAQASHDALFAPADPGEFPVPMRRAVAQFVAALHGDGTDLYGTDPAIAAMAVATTGPYGAYPAGPLSTEDRHGPDWRAPPGTEPRLAAALVHAHRLVFHPRDTGAAALQDLLDAGWTTQGIVTLSQLVSFLTFQLRVAAGLRAMGAA